MNDHVHPLRAAYIAAVRKQCGQTLRGDTNPRLTERVATKIAELGMPFDMYMDIAIKLCIPTAKFYRWPYPYFTMVVGDKTIAKIKELAKLNTANNDNLDEECLFEQELAYATSYIDWWMGRIDTKPQRCIDVPVRIKSQVVMQLCKVYGVTCYTSNYNDVCRALEHYGR